MVGFRSSRSMGRTNQIVVRGANVNVALADGSPIDVPEDPVDDRVVNEQVLDKERDDDDDEQEKKENGNDHDEQKDEDNIDEVGVYKGRLVDDTTCARDSHPCFHTVCVVGCTF